MDVVTISSNYRITIPQKARKSVKVKPGQKMRVIAYDNIITLISVRSIQEARGSLKNINTVVVRDDIDRV